MKRGFPDSIDASRVWQFYYPSPPNGCGHMSDTAPCQCRKDREDPDDMEPHRVDHNLLNLTMTILIKAAKLMQQGYSKHDIVTVIRGVADGISKSGGEKEKKNDEKRGE